MLKAFPFLFFFLPFFITSISKTKSSSFLSFSVALYPAMGISVSKKIHLATDLSFYETACKRDSGLKSFDATIQSRMNQVINIIAADVEDGSLSIDSLRGATTCLLEMNQDAAKLISDCKKDIWNDEELLKLVEEYFESSLMTLNFYNELKKCLKRAKDSQVNLLVAFQLFDEEKKLAGNNGYPKTLGALKKFKDTGDLFTEEFFKMFQSVYVQQHDMLEKLQNMNRKLDKKLKRIDTFRKVLSAVFVVTFAAVLICSIVAAAMAAPNVVAAIAAATTATAAATLIPVGPVGKWIKSFWKNFENALKGKSVVTISAQVGTFSIKEMDNIQVLINRLELQIESLMKNAVFEIEQDSVKVAIDEIKKMLGVSMKNVEDLVLQVDSFGRDIITARNGVVERIITLPHS